MFQVGRAVGAGPRAVAAFGYTRQVGAPCEVAMPPLPSLFSAALSTRSLPPLLSLCLLVLFPIFFFLLENNIVLLHADTTAAKHSGRFIVFPVDAFLSAVT